MLNHCHYGASNKDQMRMVRLIAYTREHGLTAGIQKAERDADKIETLEKLHNRASILEQEGWKALASPFRSREQWLRAQGVF
jgi:hypothetical protein